MSFEDKFKIDAGEYQVVLNIRTLIQQNILHDLESIKELMYNRYELYTIMGKTRDPYLLEIFNYMVTENEFEIQKAYGLEPDESFHKFWEVPKCECPKSDNMDRFGTKYQLIAANCPLHGPMKDETHEIHSEA